MLTGCHISPNAWWMTLPLTYDCIKEPQRELFKLKMKVRMTFFFPKIGKFQRLEIVMSAFFKLLLPSK